MQQFTVAMIASYTFSIMQIMNCVPIATKHISLIMQVMNHIASPRPRPSVLSHPQAEVQHHTHLPHIPQPRLRA